MGQRIAILGGTFDPVHNGHIALACVAAQEVGVDQVIFMPTGDPHFKQDVEVTPSQLRLAMLQTALESEPAFAVDAREVNRSGITYTADTLQEMHAESPDAELFFIIGGDSATHIMRWRRAEEIAQLCTVVAVARKGYDFTAAKRAVGASDIDFRMRFVEGEVPEVSSTQVREQAAQAWKALLEGYAGELPESFEELPIPHGAARFIFENGLYRS